MGVAEPSHRWGRHAPKPALPSPTCPTVQGPERACGALKGQQPSCFSKLLRASPKLRAPRPAGLLAPAAFRIPRLPTLWAGDSQRVEGNTPHWSPRGLSSGDPWKGEAGFGSKRRKCHVALVGAALGGDLVLHGHSPPPQEASEPSLPRPWVQAFAGQQGARWEGRGPFVGDWPRTDQAWDPLATPTLAWPWEQSHLRKEGLLSGMRARSHVNVPSGDGVPSLQSLLARKDPALAGLGGVHWGSEAALAGRPPHSPPLLSGDPGPPEKCQQHRLFSSDIFKKNSFPHTLDLATGMWGGQQLSAPQTLLSP